MSTLTEDLRKTAVDTGYVVVGVTDIAVERVREVSARAVKAQREVRSELSGANLTARAEQLQTGARSLPKSALELPTTAVSRGVEVAERVEEGLDQLADRGRTLVTRIRKQRATEDLLNQGKATLSRTRAAVTTARRGVDDTRSSAKAAVTTAGRQAEAAVAELASTGTDTARTATKATTPAVKRASTTARNRATSTRTATKRAATSGRSTATKAAKAAKKAAEKVGD